MARRAVQGICISLLGELDGEALSQASLEPADAERLKSAALFDQIDALAAAGEITRRLHKLAHEVRLFGNTGAHPGSDGLETVSQDEADKAVAFLEHLPQHVFILGGDSGEG